MKTTGTNPNITILFEDNHLLAIHKPAGVLSQEDYSGEPDVLTLCKAYLKREYKKPGNVFLGLVHPKNNNINNIKNRKSFKCLFIKKQLQTDFYHNIKLYHKKHFPMIF